MEATEYELLLSRVYGTRQEARGIDADMYRQMLEEYQNMVTRKNYDYQEDRIFEYKKAFMIIRDCVKLAITDGARKAFRQIKDKDLNELKNMAQRLSPMFYDRVELFQIITKCNFMFSNYGLNQHIDSNMVTANKRHATGAVSYYTY